MIFSGSKGDQGPHGSIGLNGDKGNKGFSGLKGEHGIFKLFVYDDSFSIVKIILFGFQVKLSA